MRAGRLRHRVTIQAAGLATADAYGAQAEVWTNVATGVPALVEALDGMEPWKARRAQTEATWQVTLRYRSDLTAEHRLQWDDRYLYLVSVNPDPRNRELICLCKETP